MIPDANIKEGSFPSSKDSFLASTGDQTFVKDRAASKIAAYSKLEVVAVQVGLHSNSFI